MIAARVARLADLPPHVVNDLGKRGALPFDPVASGGFTIHHAFRLRLLTQLRDVSPDLVVAAARARDIADALPVGLEMLAATELFGAVMRLQIEGPAPVGLDRVFVGRLDALPAWLERERRFIARAPAGESIGRARVTVLPLVELGGIARDLLAVATPLEASGLPEGDWPKPGDAAFPPNGDVPGVLRA